MAQTRMLLVLSLLILAMAAESRIIGNGVSGAKTLVCSSVYGAEEDDTCISVATAFSLSSEEFLLINPNINCDTIFVGQWLCVDGSQSF